MRSFFLREKNILILIILNTITITIQTFPGLPFVLMQGLEILDTTITIAFILEFIAKWSAIGLRNYFQSWWNRMDFTLVALSLPSIALLFLENDLLDLDFLLILRISRVFKFFRFLKFIPGVEHMILGIGRALQSSVLVLLGFFVFLFISSLISTQLFRGMSPEFFGDPVRSFYSIFKIFTVEGWYEIPDQVAENSSDGIAFFIKFYFSFLLVSGGIIGLSIVNSIFVDAMVADNNDALEEKVDNLNKEIQELKSMLEKAKNEKG
jgi:voltage-gated sodium channel